ncbi:MAG: TIGR02687 family protein [Clostridiales bacterium GWF2_38_85]|nr:MAG: TIGR02687 family protein [Clostridiales bacterium GWF2_38_85]
MNLTEVKKSLDRMFAAPPKQGAKRNIVFWYDGTGAFAEEIDGLALENAEVIKVDDNSEFAAKFYIERTNTTGNILVYSATPRPDNKDNWLTDTIKYSQTFSTDEASLILLNYKMDNALRPVTERYKAFFRNNDRCRKFESYGTTVLSETKLSIDVLETKFDIAVLSALCKLPAPDFDGVIRELLLQVSVGETALINSIDKFANLDKLWVLIKKAYGYYFEECDFEKLIILLLVTHLSHSISTKLPAAWENFNAHNTNCFVFVDNFMKNVAFEADYNVVAAFAADKLRLDDQLNHWSINDIIDCDTFMAFDHYILSLLYTKIGASDADYEALRKLINNRRNRRFFEDFETEYTLLLYACDFLGLLNKHKFFTADDPSKTWKLYEQELYKFDSYYRAFICTYDKLTAQDDYHELLEMIENAYTNRYLGELSVKWSESLETLKNDNGEIDWRIAGITPQTDFYSLNVRRFVRDNERIVVIISDALRYESAVELTQILNTEQKGSSELSSMLGTIPSYTKLGMAALLPHKHIEITDNSDILADDISTQGTDNRDKILKKHKAESVAITYEKIAAMNKPQMVDAFGGKKLIYIYHNAIDARGDNASTEREVFDATEKAFRELSSLVQKLKNNISAINILITADHGYIYKRIPLQESDKTPKETEGSIEAKRRFILTKQESVQPYTQTVSLGYLGNADIKAIVPRSVNCFKVQGAGSNYVHGGASLQEVVVPVIKFKSDKNSTRSMEAKKVGLSLQSISRKITSVIFYQEFFQREAVTEKLLPLRVKAYFESSTGERISNENIIIAESTSAAAAERTYKEKFTLRNIPYDKTKPYYLVIKEDDEVVEHEIERIPFTIDLVFGGGIQF